jgi:hypothetical protein
MAEQTTLSRLRRLSLRSGYRVSRALKDGCRPLPVMAAKAWAFSGSRRRTWKGKRAQDISFEVAISAAHLPDDQAVLLRKCSMGLQPPLQLGSEKGPVLLQQFVQALPLPLRRVLATALDTTRRRISSASPLGGRSEHGLKYVRRRLRLQETIAGGLTTWRTLVSECPGRKGGGLHSTCARAERLGELTTSCPSSDVRGVRLASKRGRA